MSKDRKAVARFETDDSRLKKGTDRAKRHFAGLAKDIGRTMRSGLDKSLSIAGMDRLSFESLGREVRGFEDRLQRMGSQANFTLGQVRDFRKEVDNLSAATGVSRDALLEGVERIVDLQGGSAATATNLDTMATALLATGAAAGDVAGLMFALSENVGVTEQEMKGVLAVIDRIGAEKAIPFRELSSELAALTGQAKNFGFEGAEGTARLVASMQVLRTGFKGTSEAATALQGIMTALSRGGVERKLAQSGIQIRDSAGNMRDLLDIVADIGKSPLAKKGLGDALGITDVIGRAEASRALTILMEQMEEIGDLAQLGTENKGFLDERALRRINSEVGRLDVATNRIKQSLIGLFTPERIERFARGMERVADVVGTAAEHAKAIGIAFAAVKVGRAVSGFAAAGGAMGTFAGSLGRATAGLGLFAGGLMAAASALDKQQTKEIDRRAQQASVRESLVGQFAGGRAGFTRAKEEGLVDKSGRIRQERLRDAVLSEDQRRQLRLAQLMPKPPRRMAEAQVGEQAREAEMEAIGNLLQGQIAQMRHEIVQATREGLAAAEVTVIADGEQQRTERVR